MSAGDWFHSAAAPSADAEVAGSGAGLVAEGPRYTEARLVGRGGMGVVEAVHDAVLGRVVARKTLLVMDAGRAARLVREARLTARLDHPGIVPVHDAGIGEDGRPWYTMRLIRGRGLDAVLAQGADLPARLAMVGRVAAACQAVAFAHANGIVHRDIKPSNVMVGPFGETVVVDWGLARPVEGEEAVTLDGEPVPESGDGPLTVLGAVMGTPRWMSPEQARGERVDVRTDVWALGRTLEVVLAGDADLALPAELPAELRAIVRRATEARAKDRYPDAGALAADLEAWLAGRRVEAHAYTAREVVLRVLSRWRVPIGVGVAALVLLVGGLGLAFSRTEAERVRAVAAEAGLRDELAASAVASGLRALRADDVAAARAAGRRALELSDRPDAHGLIAAVNASTALVELPRLEVAGCEALLPVPSADAVLCVGEPMRLVGTDGVERWAVPRPAGVVSVAGELVVAGDAGGLVGLALSTGEGVALPVMRGLAPPVSAPPPGMLFARANQQDVDLVDEAGRHVLRCGPGAVALALAVQPSGPWAVPCSDGTLLLGEGAELQAVVSLRDAAGPVLRASAAAWHGGELLLGTLDGELLRATPAGEVLRLGRVEGGRVRAILPAGEVFAALTEAGPVSLHSAAEGTALGTLPVRDGRVAWWPDGTLRVAEGGALRAWRVGAPAAHVLRVGPGLAWGAWAPDGGTLALTDGSGGLTVLGGQDGRLVGRWRWTDATLKVVDYTPDGRWLWAGGAGEGSLRVVDTASWTVAETEDPIGKARRLAATWDGRVAVARWQQAVWALGPTGPLSLLAPVWASHLQASADGRRLLVQAEQGGVQVLGLAPPGLVAALGLSADGLAALSQDGERVLLSEGRAARLVGLPGGELIGRWDWPDEPAAVALDRAGRRALAGMRDGRLVLVDARGVLRLDVTAHTDRISAIEVDQADRVALTVSWDGTARRWDLGEIVP